MDTRTDAAVLRPVTAGPEMEALGRFYPNVTWKGVIHAGGMGPGTPAMTGVGRSKSQLIQGGRWIVTDSEQDQFLEDGTFVLMWQLHWVSGWDPGHGEYRAVMADNYGHTDMYRGHIEGDRLVFESMQDTGPRLRFTWDASDPAVIGWRNEMAAPDGSWFPHRGVLHGARAAGAGLTLAATVSPAGHPGARPRAGAAMVPPWWPLRTSSQAIREFEFHISPARSSSRPQVTVGKAGTGPAVARPGRRRCPGSAGCRRPRRCPGSPRRASA